MHLVVLATATDEACRTEYAEADRFADLTAALERGGTTIQAAWNLLGKYDYLMVLDVGGDDPERAFAAMSIIAQSGTMRTESMVAIPLHTYFDIAAKVGPLR